LIFPLNLELFISVLNEVFKQHCGDKIIVKNNN